jgi:short-subunit dehydrogenase
MKVGTKYGLPEKLQKFATTPENCAKEIVDAILSGQREVIPTLSGKLMTALYRYLPFGAELARCAYKKSRQIKE